jgi:hypothetical protein
MSAAGRIPALLAAAVLAVAGCSKGQEETSAELEVARAVGAQIKRLRNRAGSRPETLTRAKLDAFGQPLLEVVIENRDARAYLLHALSRRGGGQPGQVEVWRTQDDVSVALRQGMVIATRGLGGGLLSAQVPAAEGTGGPAHGGARRYAVRADGNGKASLEMACRLQDLGMETVDIVEHRHALRHLREHCEGAGGRIVNDYWTAGGRVWQSRQWAGPEVGYIRTRQLRL